MTADKTNDDLHLKRRTLLGALGVNGAVGVVGGRAATAAIGSATNDAKSDTRSGVVEFRGDHQAGITTPAQNSLNMTAFDVVTTSRKELQELLQTWTKPAEAMTSGVDDTANLNNSTSAQYSVPQDSGEVLGLPASNLTLTFGVGPSLFDERFGLKDKHLEELRKFPKFPGDQLEPDICYGDLLFRRLLMTHRWPFMPFVTSPGLGLGRLKSAGRS